MCLGNIVTPAQADGIPAVIPRVVDQEIESIRKHRPERVVQVYFQTIATAYDKPRTGRIAVPADGCVGPLVKANFAYRMRLRSFSSRICGHEYGSIPSNAPPQKQKSGETPFRPT